MSLVFFSGGTARLVAFSVVVRLIMDSPALLCSDDACWLLFKCFD